jgi:hypothetical protein
MLAYANPAKIADEKQRGDGYGIVRFNKPKRTVTFECWPRFSDARLGNTAQFPGWPITVSIRDNDGRKPQAWLPELHFSRSRQPVGKVSEPVVKVPQPVVKVIDDATQEVVYVLRVQGDRFRPYVYHPGKYTVWVGHNKPDTVELKNLESSGESDPNTINVDL